MQLTRLTLISSAIVIGIIGAASAVLADTFSASWWNRMAIASFSVGLFGSLIAVGIKNPEHRALKFLWPIVNALFGIAIFCYVVSWWVMGK